MKILCLADTHCSGVEELPKRVREIIRAVDLIVHAGDFTALKLYEELEKTCELVAVKGNADEDSLKEILPEETTFKAEGVKFGVVHKGNYLNEFHDLGYKAMEMGVRVLIFGHIHRFVVQEFRDAIVLCPGSPTQPRLSAASCAILSVEGGRLGVEFVLADNVACGMDVRLKT